MPEKKRPSYKEKKEYEALESEIDTLTQEKDDLDRRLSSPNPNAGFSDLSDWTLRLAELTELLEEKTERWFVLAELMEQE
mmetsp:Transcript_9779/g.19913  ORF Transcript_9779/g.19913 Transcript_9779/m.19913 type:complete len:80 (+) Transcript_9779:51-290(+)